MDILNWLYSKVSVKVKSTLNSNKDLIALGADVSFQKRGDKYQTYCMTVEDFTNSIIIPDKDVITYYNGSGTNVSGTARVSNSVLIPANTLSSSGSIEVIAKYYRVSGTASNIGCLIYTNTTNTIVGATLLATSGGMSTSQQTATLARTMNCVGGNLKTLGAALSIASDYTSQTASTISFNPNVDNYLLFVTNSNVADTAICQSYRVTIYNP